MYTFYYYVKSTNSVEVRFLGLNLRTVVQILEYVSYYRWKWFSLFLKPFLLCKYTNSVTITKLEIFFVKKCFVQLAGFEPMPSSSLESCIQNTKFQMQLMISLICLKVSELWNSNAIAENTKKVLVRAGFQPDTYVICIWFTLNTV